MGNDRGSLSSDSERADPHGKAEDLLKGEGEKPSPYAWSEERRRAKSEQMKAAWASGTAPRSTGKSKAKAPRVVEPLTEEEIKFVGVLIGTLWAIAGPAIKLSPLREEEQDAIGKAAAPVIQKYLPMLGDWSLEINLVLVVGALAKVKREEWVRTHAQAEIVSISGSDAAED